MLKCLLHRNRLDIECSQVCIYTRNYSKKRELKRRVVCLGGKKNIVRKKRNNNNNNDDNVIYKNAPTFSFLHN